MAWYARDQQHSAVCGISEALLGQASSLHTKLYSRSALQLNVFS
jgi:hypothetical protein